MVLIVFKYAISDYPFFNPYVLLKVDYKVGCYFLSYMNIQVCKFRVVCDFIFILQAFTVRNAGHSAGFDETGALRIY